jgi:hypothetical protein
MKKLILLLAVAGFFVHAQAQKLMAKDVPEVVTSAFYKTYPSVKDVDWSKDGNNFMAGYDADKIDKFATYTYSGTLVSTGTEIVASALPPNVMVYVKKTYNEDEVKNACKITDALGVVTFKGKVKGMDLTFDLNGNIVSSVKD